MKDILNYSSIEDLYKAASKNSTFFPNNNFKNYLYYAHKRPDKRWIGAINPSCLLNMRLDEAINLNLTLIYADAIPNCLPINIKTPNYTDNWARRANYIEINNRALSSMVYDKSYESILNLIKFLPLIPPSTDKWANCVLISQLFPNIYGDGWNNNGENSIYGMIFDGGRLSDNIGKVKINGKFFSPEEQVKIFNDIAHLRGLKTAFRMIISQDQLKIKQSKPFNWNNPRHLEIFISACTKGIKLGFDGIFFDSLKHTGNYEMHFYTGVGAIVEYHQMQYILHEIRKRTKRTDIGFAGEKAENDYIRYKEMGVNAGASQMDSFNMDVIKINSYNQRNYCDFAWGPVVSDDNDCGYFSYESRLKRLTNALYGYRTGEEKLPSFIQMNDLFPLNYSVNTHKLMLENISLSKDNTPKSHFDNLFADGEIDKDYRLKVLNQFVYLYEYNS